jgi:hypothetical protein
MTQPKKPQKLCKFEENGESCTLPRSEHSYNFCSYHWLIVRRKRKREDGKNFRKDKHDEYNLIRSRYNRCMTKSKIRDLFDRIKAQQEAEPHSGDEGYKSAFKNYHEAENMILNPPPQADLPSAAQIANEKVEKLLGDLAKSQRESPRDSTIKLLRLYTLALKRDIGQPMSAMPFATIGRNARAVRVLGKKLGEPLVLGYGLLVDVELARILYFAHYDTPKARYTLVDAKNFCDLLVERSTGKRLQLAEYLRFYVDSARLRQASDAGEGKASASLIEVADKRAKDFANAYGEAPIVANVQFLNLTNQAEYQLGLRDFDLAYHRLTDAKEKSAAMPWNPIEAQHRIASLETRWALESENPEGERYAHTYRSVLERNPCFEYRHCLRTLKERFEEDVPDAELLTLDEKSLFVDTMHTLIQPFMIPILEGVGEAIPQSEEGGDGMSQTVKN